ncbi:M56 family metallopeptidase [Haloferula sargassicola]|uniref:Peptidase M56 domain-containing protein n=1 Tax=Haloferula sargassicola TaxID=490096 RepID=A0ABP9URT0_9BACT
MIAATLIFSVIAALLVATLGRREPRLAATALVFLLAMPLLSLLPKIGVLPATTEAAPSSRLLPMFWLAGSIFLLLRLAVSLNTLRRWRHESGLLDSMPISPRRLAEIRLFDSLDGPVAAGILRPVVFVPSAWRGWSRETRDVVLAHELAHLRRRDPLWRLLGELACAVHWFNPLSWWLNRRLAMEAEHACDTQVLQTGVSAKRYAGLLCDLASTRRVPAMALSMARPSLLRQRVQRLFRPAGVVSPLVTALLLATVGVCAVAVSVIGRSKRPIPVEEVRLRLSADPFPGD